MLGPERIPRLAERLVMDGLWEAMGAVAASRGGFFSFGFEAGHVLRVVWSEHLRGRPTTAHLIAKRTAIPRTTVLRKLEWLIEQQVLAKEGTRFCVAEQFLLGSTDGEVNLLDRAIRVVVEAADDLQRVRGPHLPAPANALPRLQERRLFNKLWDDVDRLAREQGYYDTASEKRVLRAVWSASLDGKLITAAAIARETDEPRSTVLRKLGKLMREGKVERRGRDYRIVRHWLMRPVLAIDGRPSLLDQYIALAEATVDELRRLRVQNG